MPPRVQGVREAHPLSPQLGQVEGELADALQLAIPFEVDGGEPLAVVEGLLLDAPDALRNSEAFELAVAETVLVDGLQP